MNNPVSSCIAGTGASKCQLAAGCIVGKTGYSGFVEGWPATREQGRFQYA